MTFKLTQHNCWQQDNHHCHFLEMTAVVDRVLHFVYITKLAVYGLDVPVSEYCSFYSSIIQQVINVMHSHPTPFTSALIQGEPLVFCYFEVHQIYIPLLVKLIYSAYGTFKVRSKKDSLDQS